jgi:histidine triad (HIT) family protein
MYRLRRFLFRVARSGTARFFMGWIFMHIPWAVPVKRLYETETLMAFHHPAPSYPVHILIVPKRAYASLMAVAPEDARFMQDVFAAVQTLVRQMHLDETNYRLMCNGGSYQE